MDHVTRPTAPSWLGHRQVFLATALLAFALRLHNLADRPLWYDEAFAVLYAEKPLAQIVRGTVMPVEGAGAADVHPLLYYLGLHGWMRVAGSSPLAVRLPSALMGCASVWLIGLIGRRSGGTKVGAAAMLVAAVAPFPIAYSQEARMYSLLGLAALAATYAAWRALEQPAWWAVYSVAGSLTLYAHNLGALTLVALNLLVLVRLARPARLRAIGRWSLANLAALALFSPWLLLVLPGQIGFVRRAYWIERPGPVELVRSLIVYHFNLPLPNWLLPVGLAAALLTLTLVAYRGIRLQAHLPAAFLWLGLAPLGLMWLISQSQPVFIERAVLPAALLYLVAVGWLFAEGKLPPWLAVGLGTLLLLLTSASLAYHYRYQGFPRAPFAQAASYLRANSGPGDRIIHSNKLTFFPMHYYDRQLPASWIADPPGDSSDTLARPTQEALGLYPSPDMATAVDAASHVWLVIFDKAIDEYGGWHPHVQWLEAEFRLISTERLGELQIRYYQRLAPG